MPKDFDALKAYLVRCHRCNDVVAVCAVDAQGARETLMDAAKHGDNIETVTATFVRTPGAYKWCDCAENKPPAEKKPEPDLFTAAP